MKIRALFALALFGLLSGCYLPVYFDAEVRLDRTGYYSLIFNGYMTRVQLFQDLKAGKLNREEEMAQVEIIRNDLNRDVSTKSFKYIKEGVFQIHWERAGDLLQAKTVTFLRRNESILSLRYLSKDGIAILEGQPISDVNADRLTQVGLGTEGELRVKTDAPIIEHNATRVIGQGREKTLVWKIRSLKDPTPKLVIRLE